jgi:hypothetical protein
MSNCAFCEHGVRPFYELDEKSGRQGAICHTCFHLGKHKGVRPLEPSATKSQPIASSSSSTATKK